MSSVEILIAVHAAGQGRAGGLEESHPWQPDRLHESNRQGRSSGWATICLLPCMLLPSRATQSTVKYLARPDHEKSPPGQIYPARTASHLELMLDIPNMCSSTSLMFLLADYGQDGSFMINMSLLVSDQCCQAQSTEHGFIRHSTSSQNWFAFLM